nr:YeeE/YedE thiosulfate transporter family protein [Pseudosulfitobacter pseudonitzschiae]
MPTVIETAFTPVQSLGGGALIGIAAVLLMTTVGRIMGATGILAGVIQPTGLADWSWRASVLAGMISGPLAVMLITGQMPAVEVPVSTTMLVIGGFLVGIGVTFGAGCTSGHGVCGMARLSTRSIAATLTFMLTTGITVFVVRHVIGA